MDRDFWRGKRVFITGHTGFKGSWLSIWLHSLGARVSGYALEPPTSPSLFELCRVEKLVDSTIADIRDAGRLKSSISSASPDIVIHMAAQPLVRAAYKNPAETYDINVMGAVNLFDAVRESKGVRAVINVTTDKCYENKEWVWGYREIDPLGGYDPYSSSKACSELVTSAYRSSFFNPEKYDLHKVGVASARAGNVIGGGDWAEDRLIPDCIRALLKGEKITVRNPEAVRPWQHVLEPISGYLMLAERLYKDGRAFAGGWNFGPDDRDVRPVRWIVERMCRECGQTASYEIYAGNHPHEARYLKLDCSKAKDAIGWRPRWNLEKAIDSIMEWTKAYRDGKEMRDVCLSQIEEYSAMLGEV